MFPLPLGHFEAKLQIFQKIRQPYAKGQRKCPYFVLDAGFIYSSPLGACSGEFGRKPNDVDHCPANPIPYY